jgi:hypothetical protein
MSKPREEEQEHVWCLAENQEIPKGTKMGSKVWQCSKCLTVVYFRNQPPARFHKTYPEKVGGLSVNWGNQERPAVEVMGCADILLTHVHDS